MLRSAGMAALFALLIVGRLGAQSSGNDAIQPFFLVGSTLGVVDLWERNVSGLGYSARGGARLRGIDVSLVIDHWKSLDDVRFTTALVEGHLLLFPSATVSPFLVVGLGHGWYKGVGPLDSLEPRNGGMADLGFGLNAALTRNVGVRADAVLRGEDLLGYVGQIRLAAGYVPEGPRGSGQDRPAALEIGLHGMTQLRGPWHYVEPGYTVRYTREYSENVSVGIGVGVLHWQGHGNFTTDTRAFIGSPTVQLRLLDNDLLAARVGPTIIVMGEGPDSGMNLALNAEAISILRPLGIPLTFGLGGFWMPRGADNDSRSADDEDQLGITLSAAMKL